MNDYLDNRFGACVPPTPIYQAEGTYQPLTLFTLNEVSASRLAAFVEMSADNSNFSRFPFDHFAILWVVDRTGDVLIAIEVGVVQRNGNVAHRRAFARWHPSPT
jgi:hypothetical protein